MDPEKAPAPTPKLPPVIPPNHDHRTLVLCFDGTGDQFDSDNSNIVELVSLLKKNDPHKQMVYYQSVKTFRHAIALDERRAKFKANLWNRPNDHEQTLGVHTVRLPTPDLDNDHDVRRHTKVSADRILDRYEKLYSIDGDDVKTDVEEVWFAGCHCDVGGGSVANKTRHSLARISLRWMVRECFKANTGIMFDTDALRTIGLDPTTLYPIVLPRPPPRLDATTEFMEKLTRHGLLKRLATYWNRKANAAHSVIIATNNHTWIDEELEDLKDALSPIYDQLQLKRGWWILEILPLHLRYQRGNNKWVNKFKYALFFFFVISCD
ncbi:hypothetical protein C0989_004619 [Termitomyces sp. Mn162]|nr:hypothetical protein C0989_004619 [Termitomyces sp. Mn162]